MSLYRVRFSQNIHTRFFIYKINTRRSILRNKIYNRLDIKIFPVYATHMHRWIFVTKIIRVYLCKCLTILFFRLSNSELEASLPTPFRRVMNFLSCGQIATFQDAFCDRVHLAQLHIRRKLRCIVLHDAATQRRVVVTLVIELR